MTKSELGVLFVAMDELMKSGNYNGLAKVIETAKRETLTNPIPDEKPDNKEE